MTKQDVAYFISFCIEQYKTEKGIDGADAIRELDRYGVLLYLAAHADVLHTQSRQWLMEDIENYISIRKGTTV